MLPQFDLTGFLPTSIFMWCLFGVLYLICKNILFVKIEEDLKETEEEYQQMEKDNQKTLLQLENCKKEVSKIENKLKENIKNKEVEMKKLRENAIRAQEELLARKNSIILKNLQIQLEQQFKEEEIAETLLKEIKYKEMGDKHDHL